MEKSYLKILWNFRNAALLLAVICAISFNLIKTYEELSSFSLKRSSNPYIFIGSQFEGLRGTLKNTRKIGYLTDQSLDNKIAAAKFAQAQYILAPTILDFANTDLPFVIVDFKNPLNGMKKTYELNLAPIQRSSTGIILAKNPKVQQP